MEKMAAAHQASSSSSATFSDSATNYEVFLSFHGNDVRKSFADHLYKALTRAGIRTFRDCEELQKGNKIEKELFTAIQESRVSIPIFSENYPSSKWCLKELSQIFECIRTLNQIVMPIFYKVEPREVRNQTGKYGKAFEQHQINIASDVQKWKEAMKEVGGLNGWHVNDETYEGEVLLEVVEKVYDKLNKKPFSENNNLVGAESRLREILELLDIESDSRKIIGIHGIGGIGKTTIAKAVYREVFNHFEGHSFIANVREAAQQHNGLVVLQRQLLWDTLKYEGRNITIKDVGAKVIKERLCSKKVLIVLDDVDKKDQVECFVDREWFGVGSKIIITTRDKHILDFWKSDGIYEPQLMDTNESLQLFSHHAFKSHKPPYDFLDLSKAMIESTGGLPLALQIVGSSLYLKGKPVWKAMLKKLQKVPNSDVMDRLRISFDGLDDEEKQMFLDIACFFIGMYANIVCYIWEGCGFHPIVALDSLRQRSLVTISEGGALRMHDLLRDLGRNIVCQENANEPGKRTRIWYQEDVLEVLHTQVGTSTVIGLSIDFRSLSENEGLRSEAFVGMTRLRLVQIDFSKFSWNFTHSFSELRWLSWKGCPNQCIQTAFSPRKLVVLDLSHSDITADWMGWNYLKMAKNLKVVDLSNCHQLSRTPDLSANQLLEVLHFGHCLKLDEIDTSICRLTNLVILDMSDCRRVRDLPCQIGKLTRLQVLNLQHTRLKKLPENLGLLVSLKDLKLGLLGSAVDLSVKISQLTTLKSLDLSLCDSLKRISCLPSSLTSLVVAFCGSIHNISGLPSSLTSLRVKHCWSLVKVSSTSRGLRNLKTLCLSHCNRLNEVEGFDYKLDSLEHFSIVWCESLRKLPNLRGSKYLRALRISRNNFISDFEGLEGMDSLEELQIEWCKSLRKIPCLQDSKRLRILNIRGCVQILDLTIADCCHSMELDIENLDKLNEILCLDMRLGSLRRLRIESCNNLREIHGINGLENLEELIISGCDSLERLPADLSNLKKLRHLEIEGCKKLNEMKELNISGCKFLEDLEISRFSYLERLSNLSVLKKLSSLRIEGCNNVKEILGVGELVSLLHLHISGCQSLRKLPGLSNLGKLVDLRIKDCKILTEIHGVDRLESLLNFHVSGCESLTRLMDLSNLQRLIGLRIEGYKILSKIYGVDTLESLLNLHISSCESIESLPNLSNLKMLKWLHIEGLKILTKIHGVDRLESLKGLHIRGCESLECLPNLSNLESLELLYIEGCKNCTKIHGVDSLEILPDLSNLKKLTELGIEGFKNLTKVQGIDILESLMYLNITGCESLKILPNLFNLKKLKAKDCKKLTTIQAGNNPLKSLIELDVSGCISLEKLPDCVKSDILEKLNGVYCFHLDEIDRIKLLIDGGCSKLQLPLS